MEDLNDLLLFARVVEAGGFSAAERQTGIPKSRLSRRVAALEEQLGVRLLQRSAQRVHVTEIGERVYQHARGMADEAEAVRAVVGDALAEPSGTLRVSASPLAGELFLNRWLAEFSLRHPRLRVQLDLSNRFVDLLAERVDLALRYAALPLPSSDLVARRVGASKMVLVASPTLAARHPEPQDLDDLVDWPSLGQGSFESVRPWLFEGELGETLVHHPRPSFVSDNLLALRDAALCGAGVAQLPLLACEQALTSGALQRLLPRLPSAATPAYVIYPSRRGLAPAIKQLIAFLEQHFAVGE
jgi:DNA-binding transcriptional LysR family regulator